MGLQHQCPATVRPQGATKLLLCTLAYLNYPDLAFAVCWSNDPKPERRIPDRFPHSHHRPSIIKVPSLVKPVPEKPVKRWNFRKANWEAFAQETERRMAGLPDPDAADVDVAYKAYCEVLLGAAKKTIPRSYNKNYIPGWDEECSRLLSAETGHHA